MPPSFLRHALFVQVGLRKGIVPAVTPQVAIQSKLVMVLECEGLAWVVSDIKERDQPNKSVYQS